MKFLADEGVDQPIVDLLRSTGFDIHYVLETNRGADDDKVLQIANEESRVLLTQDKDFGEMVYRLQKTHLGIVLIRLKEQTATEKAELVNYVLVEYGDKLKKAFTVIQPTSLRIRKQA